MQQFSPKVGVISLYKFLGTSRCDEDAKVRVDE
jgi:hypothetical protein